MDQLVPIDRSFQIKTFGCKVNTYDSGLLEKRFLKKGWESSGDKKSSIFVLNTCAVTEEAVKEALREVRRIKAKNPFGLVVITGCGAQVDTEAFSSLAGVDLVVANSHKGDLESIVEDHFKGKLGGNKVFKSNIFKKEDLEAGGGLESSHSRAFLKIQDGCNSFCTFCVIPFARGKSRSISISGLIQRTNDLYREGFREVVLTGVHIGDYEDGGKVFEDLVEALLQKTSMPRFRISSLEPIELSERLLELYKNNPRLCPHFHMSIQSANTRVLSAMKRKYSAEEVSEAFQRINENLPGAYVGMDVIVGFPGETEEEFEDSFERLRLSLWSRIHVFPYSRRPGTYANRIDGHIPDPEIRKRAARLRTLSQERSFDLSLAQIGSVKRGLPLKVRPDDSQIKFLTENYLTVLAPKSLDISAFDEVLIRLTGILPERRPGLDPIFSGEILSIDAQPPSC